MLDMESLVLGATALGAAVGSGFGGFKLVMKYMGNGKPPVTKTSVYPCPAHSGMEAKIDAIRERLASIENTIQRIFEILDRRYGL